MILCVGTTPTAQRSMIFDRLLIDGVNRAREVSEYASGKSVNVARVLKTLGYSPVCTGFLGGPRGALVRRDLDALQIQHDFVEVLPPTRLCTTVIDRSNRTATELVEESAEVEPSAWPALDHAIGSHGRIAKVWVLSGSLPPNSDPDTYARWVRMGLDAGAVVILDARGEPVRRALPVGGFILKLNRDELGATVGAGTEDLRAAMLRAVPERGGLIVTLGKEGAIATDGKEFWRVATPAVEVVSPVGSGDAFAAGLAASLHQGASLPESLKLAAACGAANALTDRAGHLDGRDVDHIITGTVVSPG